MIKDNDTKWVDLYNTMKNACAALEKMITPMITPLVLSPSLIEESHTLSPELEGVADKEIIEVWNSDKKPDWPHIEKFRSGGDYGDCPIGTYNTSGAIGNSYIHGARIKPAKLGYTAMVSEKCDDYVNIYNERNSRIDEMSRVLFDKIFKTTIKEGKSIEI